MKASLIASILALAATSFASPVKIEVDGSASLVKRVGPSGQLITPYDGFSTNELSGVEIKYTRVNGQSGFYTESIDVDLIDESSGIVHRVATALTSASRTQPIDAWFRIPTPKSFPDNGGNTVQYRAKITESQIGPNGPITFVAANPAFTVTIAGGDYCAEAPQGACGNTGSTSDE